MICLILTISTSEDWFDDLNYGPDVNDPGTVLTVEDDDFFEEYSTMEISEFDCFRSEDSKDSDCFMSDDDEDSVCSSPSGSEDSWFKMFDFIFFPAMNKFSAKLKFTVALHVRIQQVEEVLSGEMKFWEALLIMFVIRITNWYKSKKRKQVHLLVFQNANTGFVNLSVALVENMKDLQRDA